MHIKNIFNKKQVVISFEIFPPKKNSSVKTIYKTIDALDDLKPDYISVTYGAGGSTKDKTVEIASIIKNKYEIESLAHLTCITSTKNEINNMIDELEQNNIENILALRGDIPANPNFEFPNPLHYTYASDLVNHIRNYKNFCIGGACYPEGHIECKDINNDLKNLKQKCNSGLDFLITQLFFDNNLFYDFNKRIKKANINLPIQAGIMPIINKKQLERIVSLCGSSIPKNLLKIINKYENIPEALKDAGIAYATEQIIELLSHGVDGIHIYTMNRPEIAKKIVSNISSIIKAINDDIAI